MYVAEEAAKSAGTFAVFDLFMIVFTVIIAIGLARLAKSKERNKFALGFTSVCLLVFLVVDVLMVMSWIGVLGDFQDAVFGS